MAGTVAAIDRLVLHANILEMNGDSYRRRSAADRKSAKVDAGGCRSSVNHNPDNSGNIMEETTE